MMFSFDTGDKIANVSHIHMTKWIDFFIKAKNNGRTNKPHDPLLCRGGQLVGKVQPQRPKYIRN